MEATTTNTRIKTLRKALDLTQQAFADKIGMKRNTVANYETDRNEPSNSVISLICREFHVNETWLRTGEGEMFNALPETLADKLAKEYGLDDLGRQIMAAYLKLDEHDRMAVGRLIQNIFDERAAESAYFDEAAAQQAEWEREADEFAELAREQYLSEKLQESQARSARESGGGPGGAA